MIMRTETLLKMKWMRSFTFSGGSWMGRADESSRSKGRLLKELPAVEWLPLSRSLGSFAPDLNWARFSTEPTPFRAAAGEGPAEESPAAG